MTDVITTTALTLAIKNLDEKIEQRLDSMDSATVLARQELREQLQALNSTIDGKFLANKDLVDQLAEANAVALSAALSTQKESAAKSEVSTGESLGQLRISFEAANKATNEKIDRITSRLDMGEGRVHATDESKVDRTTDKGQLLIVASLFIAAIGVLFGVLERWH